MAVDDQVVVGEGADLAAGGGQSGVPGAGQAGDGLAEVADLVAVAGADEFAGGVVERRVVDHEDLDVGVVGAQQRVQAAAERAGPVAGADDHGDRGAVRTRPGAADPTGLRRGRRGGTGGNAQFPVRGVDQRPAQRGGVACGAGGRDQTERVSVQPHQRQHASVRVGRAEAAG
ncbi:hypothetical protein GCM10025734_66770 [Kitasatospora paranensis]